MSDVIRQLHDELDRIRETNFKGSQKAFDSFLKKSSISATAARDIVKNQLQQQKLLNHVTRGIRFTAADARKYYDDNPSQFTVAAGRTAKHILVATGSHPVRPAIPGIELADVSDDIFNWEALPASLVIVGAGYIGVEFANVFLKLGVKVTMVMRRETVLPKFDEELRTQLTDAMRAAGIDFRTKAEVRSLEKTADGLRVYPPGETHSLFVATTNLTACRNADVKLITVQALLPGS